MPNATKSADLESDSPSNIYAYCPGCGFGIEINNFWREHGKTYAEFRGEQGHCYYCQHGVKRTIPWLKNTLADAEVLLASAIRINDSVAADFYRHQIVKCHDALRVNEPEPQRSLF